MKANSREEKEGGKEQLSSETLTWINQGNINTQFLEPTGWEEVLLPQIFPTRDSKKEHLIPPLLTTRSNYLFYWGVNVFGGLLRESQWVLGGHSCIVNTHTHVQKKNNHTNLQKPKNTQTNATVTVQPHMLIMHS